MRIDGDKRAIPSTNGSRRPDECIVAMWQDYSSSVVMIASLSP
ncbi:hypothetical protein [uncultured Nitratireductor sp.]|nr:hypothetical protein [uncultured Nitratireductor sp.]